MMQIELKNVRKCYWRGKTRVEALRGVDLTVGPRDFLTLAGPSGSGKTSLLNVLGCLDSPDAGKVLVNGDDAAGLSAEQRAHLRNEKIGFVYPSLHLIPVLDVYENVELPARVGRRPRDDKRLRDWVMHLLDTVGLAGRQHLRPCELSRGQRQRVAIARALTNRPRLVLCDEPTAQLDADDAQEILQLLRKLNREERTALVVSTHEPAIATQGDTVLRLRDGVITFH
jgi:putative ABC transport system ATP-binding protein